MIHLNLVLNIITTLLSASATFLQYHLLTKNFPDLIKQITTASSLSSFFGVFSLSLPLIISSLTASDKFTTQSNQASLIFENYKKLIVCLGALVIVCSSVLLVFNEIEFAVLLLLLSITVLLKNLLFGMLGFLNGQGQVFEETLIKFATSFSFVLFILTLTKSAYWLPALAQCLFLLLTIHFVLGMQNLKWKFTDSNFKDINLDSRSAIRNHFLISLPGYFIMNSSLLIGSISLNSDQLKIITKHLYIIQGLTTVMASSVRVLSFKFNQFFFRKNIEQMQSIVNFYLKVTILFLPLFLFILYKIAPASMLAAIQLGENMKVLTVLLFFIFASVESYQVALTNLSYSAGRSDYVSVTWASAIMGLLLSAILIPVGGIDGAIAALFLSQQMTCNWFNFLKFKKFFDLRLLFDSKLLKSALTGLCLLVIFWQFPNNFTSLLLALMLWGAALLYSTFSELASIQKGHLE